MNQDIVLSVVIPCYNEEQVLPVTHGRLVEAMKGLAGAWEVVYVDDGSADGTGEILRRLAADDARVRAIFLSRNFGQQAAITAGLDHARGQAVAVIDADLQDPPELIPRMLDLWRGGAEVVYGQRTDRAGERGLKTWTAREFYRLLNMLSDVPVPRDTGDFRLMDRKVVAALGDMRERDRFLRGMAGWVGFRQQAVPYARPARPAGVTKYTTAKMFRLAVHGLTSFSQLPLRLATACGAALLAAAVLMVLGTCAACVFSWTAPAGWWVVLTALVLLSGVQLVALGIVGEYVGSIHRESKKRPIYLVREKAGFEEKGA